LGWFAEGAESAFDFTTPIKENITLTARFEAKAEYTVSFTGEGVTASTSTVYDGDCVSEPTAPTRTGYHFVGWTKAGESTLYDFTTPVTGDLTLTAKWTQNLVTVTYRPENGEADTTATIAQGSLAAEPEEPTKAGYDFLYWAKQGESTAYNFAAPVTENLTLIAVYERATVRLRFEDDDIASFRFDGVTPRTAKVGDTVSFRIWISPYYTGEPTIDAGGATVTKDGDVYTFTVEAAVTVRITGLRRDSATIEGRGTAKNPYLIKNASQLKAFTDSINDGAEKYRSAYVRLDADLDLRGVTLDPIGGVQTYFQGTFDGAGHTVSNFRLSTESGAVGFFGYIAEGVIRDLHLVSDLTVEASAENTNYIIGTVVAYSISGDVIGCSFDGSLRVKFSGSQGAVAHVGGIVGFMQGYSTDYTGTVSYCRVGATMTSDGTRAVTALGGIVGTSYGTADSAPAYVYNSAFAGEILGKSEKSGGIVGWLRSLSSVANCFASGRVEARNTSDIAAAGAIVGAAGNDTSVTNCAASATVSAVGKDSSAYERGDIIGIRYAAGEDTIDSRVAVDYMNFYSADGSYTKGGRTYDLTNLSDLSDLLLWHMADWKVDEGVLTPDETGLDTVSISATFVFGKDVTMAGDDGDLTQTEDAVTATGYAPVYWVYGGNGMNNFTADDGTISYGYFLDEDLTIRVPSSMLLTSGMKIYVGFADYSELAGEYYAVINGTEVKITLDDNGKLTMYAEGMLANYVYVYNGSHILIRDGYFAYLAYPSLANQYDLDTDYYADITDRGLLIYDTVFFTDTNNNRLLAVRGTGALGTWYRADGTGYTFHADGTGTIEDDSGSGFTYTVTGSTVRLTVGSASLTVTMDGDTMSGTDLVLTRYDAFRGTWESSFNTKKTLTFDGKGTMTDPAGTSHAYTVTDGVLTFDGGSAAFNEDGLLVYTENGKSTVFGREGSYIGYWVETSRNYQMELYGIGKDGYGTGRDTNGAYFTYIAEVVEGELSITMYYRTNLYGLFSLATAKDGSEMLYLAVFTPSAGMIVDDYNMCYYDPFRGTYHTGEGRSYEFNGFGPYRVDFHGTSGDWVVIGTVKITEADGTGTEVEYRYDRQTGTASFTYKDTSYTATLTDGGITVNGVAGYEPDPAAGLTLRAKDGSYLLSFNGKSAAGLGLATMTRADGTTATYAYTCTTEGTTNTLILTDGEGNTVLTLTALPGSITGTDGGTTVDFGIYHILGGRTYLIGDGLYLTIGMTSDASGHFTGTFGEFAVDFYYVDGTYLSMYYGTEFLYYVGFLDENTAVLMDDSFAVVTVIAVDDGLGGTYTAADGSTLTLDGRSGASDYTYAQATLTLADDEEDPTILDLVYAPDDNGGFTLYEVDRSGEEDTLIARYRLSETETEGATAYTMTTEDGTVTLWLTEITD
ncbi:MAG TPA: hypothetical protein DDY70_04450, partial [Clostridiales bacterium]|nr:hypothetical protein [Clostridiales bacterium]